MNERKWIDIEPAEPSLSAYEVSKKVINLFRHNQTVQREDDGAVQVWRIKFHLRNQFPQNQYWSDDRWKVCLAAGGGSNNLRKTSNMSTCAKVDSQVLLASAAAAPGLTLIRFLVTAGSAQPVFRDAHDRTHFSPKPEYRFDNSVANRLLAQPPLQHPELEPWTSTRQRRCH